MHFRFKLDVNTNFTMQNGEWVLISVFFLSPHLVPKDLSLLKCYYITLSDYAIYFVIIHKNKPPFWPVLVSKGTLSNILTC